MIQGTPRRPRAIAAVLILSVLILGAVVGIAFDRLVLLPRSGYAGEVAPPASGTEQAAPRDDGFPGPPLDRRMPGDRYLRHLSRELSLTEEQQARIDVILTDQQARVLEITRESRPRIREVAEDTRAAMQQVLTPEQWERFQELRHRRERKGGPGVDSAGRHGHDRMRDTVRVPVGDREPGPPSQEG
jgi:Spy/CpxP family protein refolding chaperone